MDLGVQGFVQIKLPLSRNCVSGNYLFWLFLEIIATIGLGVIATESYNLKESL